MISFQIFINIVTISVFTIFLALINPITTFSIIVISFIIFFIYYFLTKKRFIFFGKYKLILVEKTLAQIKDIFYSFKEIKLYGKEKFFIDKFINVKKAWAINKIKFQIISNLPKLLLEFFLILVIGLIFFFSRNMNLQIETILVNTTIFLIAAQRLFPKVIVIVRNFSKINYSKKAQKILIKELEKNIFENKDNIEIQFKSNILLNNISFDYETKNTIIENLNLKIKKNSFIGIKGESGRGKTTLTNIIMGLIKPTKGEIIIDNYINIHNGIHSYRRLIAYVPQKIYILNDTIKNNLFLEDYNKKSIDDDEILKILNLVRLNSFKESTGTDILNSIISDTTFKASEGEIQRFGIARALLQKKEIIILDEITSSLDEKNEANILNILKSLKNNATIIMISHKSSSLKLCDELYTLENKNLIKSNL